MAHEPGGGLTGDQLREQIDSIERRLGTLKLTLRGALRAMQSSATIDSGWPEQGGGGGMPVVVSAVETQIVRQATATAALQELAVMLRAVELELADLELLADRWAPGTVELCDGGDPPWGDPVCGRPLETFERADGSLGFRDLCAKHRARRQRWRKASKEAAG